MNKKSIRIGIVAVVIFLVTLILFFLLGRSDKPIPDKNNDESQSTFPVSSSSQGNTTRGVATSSSSQSNTSAGNSCAGLISIERDDCVMRKATSLHDTRLCSDIQNPLTKTYCISVSSKKSGTSEVAILSPYSNTTSGSNQGQTNTSQSSINSALGKPFSFSDIQSQIENLIGKSVFDTRVGDPVAEFFDRMANKTPLALFIVNPVETKPGDVVKATGSGFAKSGNTVFIGSESVSNISSNDGMTVTFTMPTLPEGKYEAWITNDRGSTRRSQFPIFVTVSDTAGPLPKNLAVSPESPSISDTITVSGDNLSNIAGVYTSLGTASGLTFNLQGLPYYSFVKDAISSNPIIKAVPLVIMVMTKSGLSDPLMVNVTIP